MDEDKDKRGKNWEVSNLKKNIRYRSRSFSGSNQYFSAFYARNGGMTMKRFAVVIFYLVIFLFWTTPRATAQFSEAGVEQFKVAVNAPDFTLRKLSGGDVSLKELRGKVIILNFFATY